jgi:hypothetical protein
MALFRQIARAPIPPGSRGLDDEQGGGVGVPRAQAGIDVALPRAQGAQGADRRVVIAGDRGDRDGILVDIPPNIEGASVRPGCPSRSRVIGPGAMPEAALAGGPLTRGGTGGQPTHRKS